ncbi:MAG: hypothetical protein LBK41_03115 [Clostridiales bacterium]|jgi:hypothetical protein|nr:hypothetical protein [Clostridiales bacterium]
MRIGGFDLISLGFAFTKPSGVFCVYVSAITIAASIVPAKPMISPAANAIIKSASTHGSPLSFLAKQKSLAAFRWIVGQFDFGNFVCEQTISRAVALNVDTGYVFLTVSMLRTSSLSVAYSRESVDFSAVSAVAGKPPFIICAALRYDKPYRPNLKDTPL